MSSLPEGESGDRAAEKGLVTAPKRLARTKERVYFDEDVERLAAFRDRLIDPKDPADLSVDGKTVTGVEIQRSPENKAYCDGKIRAAEFFAEKLLRALALPSPPEPPK